ncbi:mycofactocin-coupled SDR family oxidoreductase [Rhodococcus sp. HM1]|uniref:mycofactocin-coupled SDR family oxidoreductase n=1 Tax=Rhodococcus sp. HM1 TaxID=2937759 RepID=UPI002009DD30|nr:mycofactocin-coupled SDR family oxidoreductase [Rhodococcus sp. HM1]MCK8670362.1 mycofactocin-coupled SDR family oxidoreductase [Rhodococcus sp. HM1]
MSGRVAGKVALITGAARGQGRAYAVRLAEEGADVVVVDVCAEVGDVAYAPATPEDLEETVRLVEKTGRRVVSGIVDVRDLDALRGIVDDAVRQLGRLDVVVANAAICSAAPWNEMTPQIFEDTIGTNVTGVWNTVMAGAPHLVEAGGGSIVLISSAAGIKVQPFAIPYTTSKFAVRGMAKAFAAELAQHHIRVNSVHPTGVNTPMVNDGALGGQISRALEGNTRLGAMMINMMPVDIVQPEDVADTVLFLASDESRYITAHELAPDAGVTEY